MTTAVGMRSRLISSAFTCFCFCLVGNIFFKLVSLICPLISTKAILSEQNHLNHPFIEQETVPNWALLVLCGILPILCFAVFDWFVRPDDVDALPRCCTLFLAIGMTGFVTDFLKLSCRQPRPNFYDMVTIDEQNAYMSFPSGHSSLAFTAMLLLSLCLQQKFLNAPYCLTFSPMLVACLVAWSRVHDHWHHPIDVYAGAVIGVASVIITRQTWYVLKCDVWFPWCRDGCYREPFCLHHESNPLFLILNISSMYRVGQGSYATTDHAMKGDPNLANE